MKITPKKAPRKFMVGINNGVTMHDCGTIELAADEQVTFITEQDTEYDVARKSWGFYATPSLNSRLKKFRLKPVLVKNTQARWFILLVEQGKEADFKTYCESERLQIIGWLDDEATLKKIEEVV